MAEQTTTQTSTTPQPKTVANNIANGITERASGIKPGAESNKQAPVAPPVDQNAGKEKFIVEGKEIWLTPEQSRAYIQKGIAFEPKMDQLNYLQKETQAFMQALVNNPLDVLKKMAQQRNIPIETIYEKVLDGDWPDSVKEIVGKRYYGNVVEPMKLSPEELKARENEKKLSTYELQEKTRQETFIKQENQARVMKAMTELKTFIGEAMKDSGLPSNDTAIGTEMARMVADTMRLAQRQQKSITPKQAIDFVKTRMKSFHSSYYEFLADRDDEGESLVAELGEKVAAKVQKYWLKKAKAQNPAPVVNAKPQARPGERKTINNDDFHDYLDALKKGGK